MSALLGQDCRSIDHHAALHCDERAEPAAGHVRSYAPPPAKELVADDILCLMLRPLNHREAAQFQSRKACQIPMAKDGSKRLSDWALKSHHHTPCIESQSFCAFLSISTSSLSLSSRSMSICNLTNCNVVTPQTHGCLVRNWSTTMEVWTKNRELFLTVPAAWPLVRVSSSGPAGP
eukprot:SAG31_NODE_2811_length_5052_cov_3.554613_4_plen_176_part_00